MDSVCGQCRFFHRYPVAQHPQPGQCRQDRPQVVVLHRMTVVGNGQGLPTQQVEEYLDSAYPPVNSLTGSCGRFEHRIATVEEAAIALPSHTGGH